MKFNKEFFNSKGQALIVLLFFSLIGITVISAAALVAYGNISSASIVEQGNYAYYVAESGAEEGLLRLLRNPSYSGTPQGQPLSVNGGSVTIVVSGGTITAVGTYNNNVRKIQVETAYSNYARTVISWKEIY